MRIGRTEPAALRDAALLAYGVALTLQVATPGPSVICVASLGVSRGFVPAAAMGLGVALGDLLLAAAILIGFTAIATTSPWFIDAVRYLGAGCLVWLGVQALKGSDPVPAQSDEGFSARSVLLGGCLAMSNPKGILLHASLLPTVAVGAGTSMERGASFLTIVLVVNLAILSLYAAVAARFRRAARDRARLAHYRYLSAVCTIGCAGFILLY